MTGSLRLCHCPGPPAHPQALGPLEPAPVLLGPYTLLAQESHWGLGPEPAHSHLSPTCREAPSLLSSCDSAHLRPWGDGEARESGASALQQPHQDLWGLEGAVGEQGYDEGQAWSQVRPCVLQMTRTSPACHRWSSACLLTTLPRAHCGSTDSGSTVGD